MRETNLSNGPSSPLSREAELLAALRTCGIPTPHRLRLVLAGNSLMLDGFVVSLEQKVRMEKMCRRLAPGSVVVNRLRVAPEERQPVF